MYKVYFGMVGDSALDNEIRHILRKNGFDCKDASWRFQASFSELDEELNSSDVLICYSTPGYGSANETAEVNAALRLGKPVVAVLLSGQHPQCGGRNTEDLLRLPGVTAFSLEKGAAPKDLPGFLSELLQNGSADTSWIYEESSPEEPYEGEEGFLYVSFAESDRLKAYRIITNMQEHRYRVWYDNGKNAGSRDDLIAEKIGQCACMIALISPSYIDSDACRDEISMARDLNRERLLVYLEKTKLSPGMAMRLLRLQAVHKYTYKIRKEFYDKLYSAKGLSPAKED